MQVIDNLRESAEALLESLDSEDSEAIRRAQRRFSQAIEEAWNHYQKGGVEVATEGLPRVMYLWAVQELPDQVDDPEAWPEIEEELRRFLRTMDFVVEPSASQ